MNPWVWLLLAAHVGAFAAFGLDKTLARLGRRRIRERALLWWVFLGCVGAWAAMSLFRHKTRKMRFRRWAVLWTVVNPLWFVAWLWWRG